MKTTSHQFSSARVLALGSLIALAGCASIPTRSSTHSLATPGFAAQVEANVEKPQPLRTVAPKHPWTLRRAGISGLVNVQCLVDAAGSVKTLTVIDSTDELFVKPTVDAIKQWTFTPGTRDGVPVAMRVNIPVAFTLIP